ncbi:hypothetical protein ULG90_25065 [Halopseudomonas pachastrellae]|nr:hypothetical protein ULG90_25065 [Halopseudomonas pachastrellae]
MRKQGPQALFVVAAISIASCSDRQADYRNVEISNGKVYYGSEDTPFSGFVSNVPGGNVIDQNVGRVVSRVNETAYYRSVYPREMTCDINVEDGLLIGDFTCYKTGSQSKVLEAIADGERDIDIKIFNPAHNALIGEAHLTDGQFNGDFNIYSAVHGKTLLQAEYALGALHGDLIEYNAETGMVLHSASYENGKLHGKELKFRPNGEQALEAEYFQGKYHGFVKQWAGAGLIQSSEYYQHGIDEGVHKGWYNGQLIRVEVFESGRYKYREYNEDMNPNRVITLPDEYSHIIGADVFSGFDSAPHNRR